LRVRCGLHVPPFGTFGNITVIMDLAREAEAAGWHGFFLWDHLLYATDLPFVDPWITLSAVATTTTRIRLGPLVTPLPRRRPWKVAREAVTLDHLSQGRLVLGVGLGIDFWREYGAFRGEAGDDVTRAEMLDDAIEILTGLWSGEEVTYQGSRSGVDRVRFLPPPRQQPRIPLWCGALWPLRAGPTRRAARCDGIVPFRPGGVLTPDNVREVRKEIARHRPQADTADDAFEVGVFAPRSRAAELEDAGATWLLEAFAPDESLTSVRRTIAEGPPLAN